MTLSAIVHGWVQKRLPLASLRLGLSLAVVSLCALAMPGGALALSGSSASGEASAAQYTSTPNPSGGGLPFTGYVLISVVCVGLIMLSVGLVLRRRVPPAA